MNTNTELPNVPGFRLLTGGEVAERLNCSRAFAYRLMRQGEIPTVRLGRAVRVRIQDLEAFILSMLTHNETWSMIAK
jgi:excisionase family DNA binding protein